MERIRHDLRLSETVSPFGVGSIVDVRGESLIAPDTSWWDKSISTEIHCERLTSRLGGSTLREAPTHSGRPGKDTRGLLYWRFPTWRFCERCTRLSSTTGRYKGKWKNNCDCGGALVPMRYVAVCDKGSHIQDIPWFMWTHRGGDPGVTEHVRFCRSYKELKFVRSATRGEGLGSLQVVCNGCGRTRPLTDLVMSGSLKRDGIRCDGTQPWQDSNPLEPCEHQLVAVQRGATGNYIADRISALDIPEEAPESTTRRDRIRAHIYFEKVVADNGGPQAEMVAGWIADDLGCKAEEVLALALDGTETESTSSVVLDLKDGEWAAFLKKLKVVGRDHSASDFVVDSWQVSIDSIFPPSLTKPLAALGQVNRVREVRALTGFRRHSAEAAFISADLATESRHHPTYPAVELFGEGIFIQFDEGYISGWEQIPAVKARAEILLQRQQASSWAHRLERPEPRFVAIHTLAHLMIRRLAFASGYSSASLQERIYASSDREDPTAGLLIYTAAGDAQGTLGGLVRLGHPDRLLPLLLGALDDADVCSNDPVCIESDRQGATNLNLSACHGCSLVSETSCETANRFLDRQLVLGGAEVPGLFDHVLEDLRKAQAGDSK
ncbi:DUF1998 domain-containing protein [Dietzia sp. B32]|uniref:DUF1998 domain-containing protein n=1 Tax=Dietzia sp. B32 TaxID=2915130 RepID=UPI0021ADFEB1|nr:DUF1998 domain-containing protein [Dietzia sp. B32]UVE94404.1 DUF1998 domain-containing protein [Dietzia sp. B32]